MSKDNHMDLHIDQPPTVARLISGTGRREKKYVLLCVHRPTLDLTITVGQEKEVEALIAALTEGLEWLGDEWEI